MSTSEWTATDQAYADFVSEIACEVSASEDDVLAVLGALEERGLFSVSDAAAWLIQEYGPTPPIAPEGSPSTMDDEAQDHG